MKVCIVGAGAREHALCLALRRDPAVVELLCAPGNAGTAEIAEQAAVDASDPTALVALARRARPDLVVIGPEAPLVVGAADALRAEGFATFGPSAAAARIEGSKAFAKDVMAAARVPTAQHWLCEDPAALAEALDTVGPPYVVKHDGLAAGKGVIVTADRDAAERHAAGHRVVVEQYLDGPEVSLFAVTDGTTVVPLHPAQDAKRAGDGDTGPNTGGMGAYSPLPWAPKDLMEEVTERILVPTVRELAQRGASFSGLLYAGLALTADGPRVVEFNARFGDPETQVVLARLQTPLAGLLLASAVGDLGRHDAPEWSDLSAVTVVIAAENYPGPPILGDLIGGLGTAADVPGVQVLHAGTKRTPDGVVSAGGRVLSVTALGPDLATARSAAYTAVDRVELRGSHHRTDIAAAAARGEISTPPAELG